MKKLIIVYVVLIIAVILLAFVRYGGDLLSFLPIGTAASAEVNSKKIDLIVAKSEKDRIKGLSGRQSLSENQGMIFVFEDKNTHAFWMKDMNFPIDIVFLNDNVVVDVIENVPNTLNNAPNLTIQKPDEAANHVLELRAGKAKELGIKKGTKITLQGI